jgi:hypothetical protein
MIEFLLLALLLADPPSGDTVTLPRQRDANPVEQRPAQQQNPTDPLFDRTIVATDDPAFVLTAIESSRQGEIDARTAEKVLRNPRLRDAAARIARQNEAARTRLESLAQHKGWRLPEGNPERATTLPASGEARAGANFIINQISFHQATLAQYRAQLDGKGDAELRRALRESLPGYQKNLDLLLRLKL